MAYLQDHFLVTPAQYQFVRDLTRGCDKDTFKFFCHVLVCSIFRLTSHENDMFIPVAWETYYRKLKHVDVQWLEAMELLVIIPCNRWLHRSREFKVANWILGGFVAAGDTPTDEYTPQMIDLFTGRLSIRTRKSKINLMRGLRSSDLLGSGVS